VFERRNEVLFEVIELGSAMARAGRIAFDVEQARNQLLRHGYVYTLRAFRRTANFDTNVNATNNGVPFALVTVKFIKGVDLRDFSELEPYVKSSGFNNAAEWVGIARAFYARANYFYLYRASVDKVIGTKEFG
jgi:hypothetical protein